MLNKQKPQGTFLYTGDKATLAISQKKRALLTAILTVLFIVPPLFIDQAMNKLLADLNLLAILQTYVILVLATDLLLVYTFICTFTRYKLRDSFPASKAPYSGWDKHTWVSYEFQFYCICLISISNVVGLFFAFDILSLLLAVISLGCSVIAFFIKRITFLAYKEKMELVDDKDVDKRKKELEEKTNEEIEEFYE